LRCKKGRVNSKPCLFFFCLLLEPLSPLSHWIIALYRINAILEQLFRISRVVDTIAPVMEEELIIGIGVLQHLVRVVQEGDSASLVASVAVPRYLF